MKHTVSSQSVIKILLCVKRELRVEEMYTKSEFSKVSLSESNL